MCHCYLYEFSGRKYDDVDKQEALKIINKRFKEIHDENQKTYLDKINKITCEYTAIDHESMECKCMPCYLWQRPNGPYDRLYDSSESQLKFQLLHRYAKKLHEKCRDEYMEELARLG